jgi:hypothetical protein
VQPARRVAEVQLLRERGEVPQVSKLHGSVITPVTYSRQPTTLEAIVSGAHSHEAESEWRLPHGCAEGDDRGVGLDSVDGPCLVPGVADLAEGGRVSTSLCRPAVNVSDRMEPFTERR